MNLVKWNEHWTDPFDLITTLENDMNRLFSRPWGMETLESFLPSLDLTEDENRYISQGGHSRHSKRGS